MPSFLIGIGLFFFTICISFPVIALVDKFFNHLDQRHKKKAISWMVRTLLLEHHQKPIGIEDWTDGYTPSDAERLQVNREVLNHLTQEGIIC